MNNDDIINNLKRLREEHDRQLVDIRTKLHAIETIPKAKALTGKCFKYLNSFGFKANSWIYIHILDVNADGNLIINRFSMEGKGQIDFKFWHHEPSSYFSTSSFVPLTLKQYNKEFNRILNKLKKFNKVNKNGEIK